VNITRLPTPFGECINSSEADASLSVYQQLHDGVEYSTLVRTPSTLTHSLTHSQSGP